MCLNFHKGAGKYLQRIVERIQPWLEKYPWITADLGGYQMGEWHIVNGAILSKVSFQIAFDPIDITIARV